MKKLMVLDGNSIVNRAYYGVRLLTTRDGRYTNAIFGFLNILTRLLDDEKPDALCVTFDLRAPTFRHKAYEGYKAQRKGMPEELAQQMPVLKDVLRAMNVPLYELEGFEADDLIGTISKKCGDAGWACVIVTGDRDSLQLIGGGTGVRLVSTKGGQSTSVLYDEERFTQEYGFKPPILVDLKGLMGDSSDNIPGVAGVGEKTAKELIAKFGSLDGVYENLESADIRDSVRKKLDAGRDMARLSYELATICREAPVEFVPEQCMRTEPNRAELYRLFLSLEFTKLIDKFGLSASADTPKAEGTVTASCTMETVTDDGRAAQLLEAWRGEEYVVVTARQELDALAVLWQDGECAAIICRSELAGFDGLLRELFSESIKKVAHDVKSLMSRLLAQGCPAEGFIFDTAVGAYLLDPSAADYSLNRLAMSYFGFELLPESDFTAEDAFAPLADKTAAYAAISSHAATVAALYHTLPEKLRELHMAELYNTVELPLCRVLAEMENEGFLVEKQTLIQFGEMLSGRIDSAQKLIYEAAGGEFNINSTKQLGEVLFERLGLPPVKKTKTGYSTNADVLEKLRGMNPIIDEILEYRQLTKLKSTYADGLLKVISPDGRIRSCFQNTVTATGRLSSTEPNLQNIPVRQDLGAELRKMFVAKPGCILVDADYSQIELRVLAHIAGDEAMIGAFKSGEDFHTVTASQVFGVPLSEVTPLQRRHAKAVNFGIVYGISAFSLAQDIGVSPGEAKAYIESYMEKYPGVRDYMARVVADAKESGYVETLMHRRRYLPDLKSSNFNVRSGAERIALNTPIQGTAADVIKLAMVRVRDRLLSEKLAARLVLQVHDELIVEAPEAEAERVAALLTEEMEGAAELNVPLVAEAKWGKSWQSAK